MASTTSKDTKSKHECSNLREKVVKLNTPAGKLVKSVAYECLDCSMVYVSQDKAEKLKGDVASDPKAVDDPDKTDDVGSSLLSDPLLTSNVQDISNKMLSSQNSGGASGSNQKVQADTQPNVYSCKICTKTMLFTSLSTMMEHYKNVHGSEYNGDDLLPHRCWNCDKVFSSQANLMRHQESNACQENVPFRCKHCQKTFHSSNGDDFQYHVLQCTNFSSDNSATHFECSLCGINFIRHQELVEHHRNQHMREKVFKCDHCDAKFSWQDNLERHVKIHEEESTNDDVKKEQSKVLCRVCSNPFHSVVSLSSHMSLSHPNHPLTLDGSWGLKPGTETKKRRKVLPAKSQPMLKLVDNAAEIDTDLSDFVAELAASSKHEADDSSSESASKRLKKEPNLPESSSDANPIVIEVEEDLGVHKLVNAVAAQNDPHSLFCNTCDKTYQNPEGEHAGSSMNLRCIHCGWTFQQPYQLEAHLEHLHPAHIRMSMCQLCSTRLRNNTAMDKHYAVEHPESRAFHCYQCDSHFNTKSCLRGHLLRHQQSSTANASGNSIGGGEHACPHCNMRYAHAHQLLTHITKSHPTFAPRPPSLLSGNTSTTTVPGAAGLGNTQFVCGFCLKKFAYEGSLKIHLKSHEDKIKAQMISVDKGQ